MLIQVVLLVLGFALLIKGAGWLVDGGSALGRKHNISNLTIGLTVVAFGTSAPELVVNVIGALQGHQDIVFGNVLGSNNFNLFLILGIAGLITPLTVQSSTVWKEIPLSMVALAIMFFLANDFQGGGEMILSRIDGALLLACFAAFMFYIYRQLPKDPVISEETAEAPMTSTGIWWRIIIGLTLLVAGGRFVVQSAVGMATDLGISEKIIGLTIVAAGTSLPELATSVVAAFKKNNDIAVGNIIGSNIFNLFLILGASAVIHPIGYDRVFNTDVFLLAGGTVLLFAAMFSGGRKKLDRWEAGLLAAVFIAYTIYLVSSAAGQ